MKKRISLVLLILCFLLCFCSCGNSENVIENNILSLFTLNNSFSFYYKNDITGLNENEYSVYYLAYDFNGDGNNEDCTYLVKNNDTSDIQLDIYDTHTGNNIAPRISFDLNSTKISVTDKKTGNYYHLIYITTDENGKTTTQKEIYSDKYYIES